LARRTRAREDLVAGLAFLFLSIGLFGRTVIFNPSKMYIGNGPDPSQYMWALVWWPHALARGLNPFLVPVVWAPYEFNLAWFTSIPGPSLILWPLTTLFGPVVAYNLWFLLAPATAAWTGFFLCRYITRSFWPSMLGGYLFGFSSYVVGQMAGHLDLVTVFPVPIAVLLVLLRLNKAISVRRFILALAGILTFQFLASPEIFATMAFFGTIAISLGAFVFRRREWRAVFAALAPISAAYLTTLVLLSPFLYYMLVPGEPANPLNSPLKFSTDLLNFVIPTSAWLGAHSFRAIAGRFGGNYSENGAYLGLPLIWMICLFARSHWKQPIGKLLICSLVFIIIASLGPRLHIAGLTAGRLPWTFLQTLPLIDQALPARFVLYSFLVAAIMTAIYLDDTNLPGLAKVLMGLLAVLFLWPAEMPVSKVDTPNFFVSGIYRQYIAAGDTVIILPSGNSLLWQAQTDMHFKMAGAYMDPPPSQAQCWPDLSALQTGQTIPDFPDRLKSFLVAHDVKAIVATRTAKDFRLPLLATLGPPVEVSDVAFYRVTSEAPAAGLYSSHTDSDQLKLETILKLRRYAELISAAEKYAPQHQRNEKLTPREGEGLKLSSPDRLSESLPGAFGRDPNGLDNPWFGRWGSSGIGVGLSGCRWVLESVIQNFAPYARKTYFPYPFVYNLQSRESRNAGELLMVFSRSGLHDAAKAAELIGSRESITQ
jgi:hypothetical protein